MSMFKTLDSSFEFLFIVAKSVVCVLHIHVAHSSSNFPSLSLLLQRSTVRIVVVSSSFAFTYAAGLDLDDMHWKFRKYDPWKAYGQSKICNVLFAKELARR